MRACLFLISPSGTVAWSGNLHGPVETHSRPYFNSCKNYGAVAFQQFWKVLGFTTHATYIPFCLRKDFISKVDSELLSGL